MILNLKAIEDAEDWLSHLAAQEDRPQSNYRVLEVRSRMLSRPVTHLMKESSDQLCRSAFLLQSQGGKMFRLCGLT